MFKGREKELYIIFLSLPFVIYLLTKRKYDFFLCLAEIIRL